VFSKQKKTFLELLKLEKKKIFIKEKRQKCVDGKEKSIFYSFIQKLLFFN
jgi:hypothetical protein